jgi:formylglycine-generating enzyme required for sulfatase activity
MGILPMLSAEKTQEGREPLIAEKPRRQGAGETVRRGQIRSPHPLILSVAPVFGLGFSRGGCGLVISFVSATLPIPYSTLMTTPRPAALLFLRSLILAVGCFGAVASVQAAPVVSNLTAAQRAGTKLVDISYDLAAPGFGSVAVTLEASSDGGATWTVPVASATGAVGGSVTPGTGKTIVWNAGVDWPQSYSTQMRFRVVAEDGFSYIPGGSFAMGRTSGDTDADAPPITVTVSPFYMQQTETTKAQWDEVRTWGLSNGYTDLAVGSGKASNHPVHSVNWTNAVKWCNARSEKEGLTPVYTVSGAVMRTGTTAPDANWSANGYRLPTEAEWEKAARGGVNGKRFPSGSDTINHSFANYKANSSAYSYDTSGYAVNTFHPSYATGGWPYSSPVGSFPGNGYGLYDMDGNLWEWCWDWYGGGYYSTSSGTTDPKGPSSGNLRVGRGGAWGAEAIYARCSQRGLHDPNSGPHNGHGFRPARTHLIEDMSLIPGGSFTMGVTSGDTDANAPSITVTVSPFYMQQTETTKAQWDEVRTWALNNGYTDLPTGEGKATNHPVQTVSWWDVVKWCNARSEKEGLTPVYTLSGAVMKTGQTAPDVNWSANGYRLPTEAEWEKAARGGVSGKRFPWGTDTISHAQANYLVYSQNGTTNFYSYDVEPRPPATGTYYHHPSYTAGGTPYTSPVGSFAANGYGLYDMAGNVWEWCWDWYGGSYYTTSNGTTDPRGPASGTSRVLRGGGWDLNAFYARCANRINITPGGTNNPHGFRPVRSFTADTMVHIPGGSFTMGVTSGDSDNDAPSITVAVSAFYIQQTETTKFQWDEVRTWALSNGYTDLAAGAGWTSTHPIQTVSWWDVVKWCNARSEMEGLIPVFKIEGSVMRTGTTVPTVDFGVNGYRLPTEAEWEKAARGGTSGKRFPWATDTINHNNANYYANSIALNYDTSDYTNYTYHPNYANGSMPYTAPVGSFPSNGFGLYDMSGNVWEWCLDWFGSSVYSDGSINPIGPISGTKRVVRGGSWFNDGNFSRCAIRLNNPPGNRYFDGGFRTVRKEIYSSTGILESGNLVADTTEPPFIKDATNAEIFATGATLGGNVTSDGGATIIERGVVYSATTANPDPLIGGTGVTKVTATGTTGVFTAPVTGLNQGTGYSYKAYATNSHGTTYSTVATFTTLSTNADLSALTLSSGTLSPTFASATTSYTASVPNATTSITVTPTRAQADATIEVRVNTGTYAAVTSGSPSAALSLNVGTNTLDVRVTAQDGTTQKTYTVTVTRMATQSITFANPGAQLANATVNLSATGGGSGNPVTFTVEGPPS